MHVIAGKAVCFKEALKPEFKEYQRQFVKNAGALAEALMETLYYKQHSAWRKYRIKRKSLLF